MEWRPAPLNQGEALPGQPGLRSWDWEATSVFSASFLSRLPIWKFHLMATSYRIMTFDGLPERLAEVRERVRTAIGDVDGADDVVLVASELATNAIVHTASGWPGGSFVLELAEFVDGWHVRVSDQGGLSRPKWGGQGDDAEAGRGLPVVAALARAWGEMGDGAGRIVWAEVPYPKDNEATALCANEVVSSAVARALQQASA